MKKLRKRLCREAEWSKNRRRRLFSSVTIEDARKSLLQSFPYKDTSKSLIITSNAGSVNSVTKASICNNTWSSTPTRTPETCPMSVSSVTSVLDREASSQSIFEGMTLHVPPQQSPQDDDESSPLLVLLLLLRITRLMIRYHPSHLNLTAINWKMIAMNNMTRKHLFKMS